MALNEGKVMTGNLAVIRKNGTVVGKMRNISWTEDMSRGEVRGIGTALTSEVPILSWGGRGSCDFYEVDFSTTGLGGINRNVKTNQEFDDQLMLEGDGFQLDIFKKVTDVIDGNGKKIPKAVPYATLGQVYIDSEGSNITENTISGHNVSFRYLFPIKNGNQ